MIQAETTLILSASPRKDGNSDAAARLLAELFTRSGMAFELLFCRDYAILPCTGCDACRKLPPKVNGFASQAEGPFLSCPLSLRDESRFLLERLMRASALCIISPIYMYHLPAGFKGLLDRLQPFWNGFSFHKASLDCLGKRFYHVLFLAGRTKGEKLFSGAALSLKWALRPVGFVPGCVLELRGVDRPGDFSRDELAKECVRAFFAQMTQINNG